MAVVASPTRGFVGLCVCLVFGILLAGIDLQWLLGMAGNVMTTSPEQEEGNNNQDTVQISKGNLPYLKLMFVQCGTLGF